MILQQRTILSRQVVYYEGGLKEAPRLSEQAIQLVGGILHSLTSIDGGSEI